MPTDTEYYSKTILVAGYGKLPQGTSAEQLHKVLAFVAIAERESGVVLEASSTLATSVADTYVSNALVGMSLRTDTARYIEFLMENYQGLAQRAVIAAFRDLVRRFNDSTQQR